MQNKNPNSFVVSVGIIALAFILGYFLLHQYPTQGENTSMVDSKLLGYTFSPAGEVPISISHSDNLINGQVPDKYILNYSYPQKEVAFVLAPQYLSYGGETFDEMTKYVLDANFTADGAGTNSHITSLEKLDTFPTTFSDTCSSYEVTVGYFTNEVLTRDVTFPLAVCTMREEYILWPDSAYHAFLFYPVQWEESDVSQTVIKDSLQSFSIEIIES